MSGSTRLPRGRHRLSREEVAASQRTRMLQAMTDCAAESGYVSTSVADVIRRAGVSRETFYQQFSSKQDCFSAAFDETVSLLLAVIEEPDDSAGDSASSRLDAFIKAYLEGITLAPAVARVFLIEVYAAGPEAIQRRAEVQRRIARVVADIIDARSDEDRFACEAMIAATAALVTTRLAADDMDGIRALHGPIAGLGERLLRERDA